MPVFVPRAVPGLLLSLSLALAGCGWEVPPVEELPPLRLSPDAGTPAQPPTTPPPTVPAGALPDAPTGVVATAGDATVRVTWNAANGNGLPITEYTVELVPESGRGEHYSVNLPTLSGLPPSQVEMTFGGYVRAGIRYSAYVKATTARGSSPRSQPFVGVMPYAGSCGTLQMQSSVRLSSGLYTLTLNGSAVQVYCEMTTMTGAWTLVLHSAWTGQAPWDYRLSQPLSSWRSSGVGWPGEFSGHASSSAPYVLPLDMMRALFDGNPYGRVVRFESDNAWSLTQLNGARMSAKLELDGYNVDEVAYQLCGGRTDCFLGAGSPFATSESGSASSGCASSNLGLGWWYQGVGCSRYHPFRTDSRALFSGNSRDPSTNRWTWWVQ